MVEAWSTRAGLYAIFAAAALVRCRLQPCRDRSPEEQEAQEQLDEETVETVELDPAISKLDEADIGISGPEQIEEAIETLDAQTESRPPLVSGIGGTRRRAVRPATCSSASAPASCSTTSSTPPSSAKCAGSPSTPTISIAPSSAASATCTTSSTRSKRARCRSSSRCCRSSKARSIPSRIRGRAPPACGSSFPAPAAATA